MVANRDAAADHSLIQRCLAGEPGAWNAFFARFHPQLIRMAAACLHAAPNRADLAEEIAGRVWLSLVVKDGMRLRAYDPARGTLAAFLTALVRQEVQLLFRGWARHSSPLPLPPSRPDHQPAEVALGPQLEEFGHTLTPQERRFFHVHLLAQANGEGLGPLSPCNYRKLKQRVLARLHVFLKDP